MLRMGTLGSAPLGWRPFWFVVDVVRGGGNMFSRNIGTDFSFRGLGCFEFEEEWRAGIDWLRWLEYRCEEVEATYSGERSVKVWMMAPVEFFEEAAAEFATWVADRDLETDRDTSFAICVHENFTKFQDAVAWWSLADGVLLTFDKAVAVDLMAYLGSESTREKVDAKYANSCGA